MRRIFAVLVALVLLATACSSSGDPETSTAPVDEGSQTTTSPTETPPEAGADDEAEQEGEPEGDKLPAAAADLGDEPDELAFSNWDWGTSWQRPAVSEPVSNATDAPWVKVESLTGGLRSGDYAGAALFGTGERGDTFCLEYNDYTPHHNSDGNLHRLTGVADLGVSLTAAQVDTIEKIMDAYNDSAYWNGSDYSADLYDGIASAIWSVTDGHGLNNSVAQDIMAKVQDGTYTNNTAALFWARSDNGSIQDQVIVIPPASGPETGGEGTTPPASSGDCEVTLFDFPAGDTELAKLGVGEYNFDGSLGWLDNDVESIYVPAGMTITVSEHHDGQGWTKYREGPGTFEVHDDIISWIKIEGSCDPAVGGPGSGGDDKSNIGDTVWFDADEDGDIDSSESGIAGVSVELYDDNTRLLETTTTDDNGGYMFTDLNAGSYSVYVNPDSLPDGYEQTYDADGILDNASYLTIGANETVLTQDFGYTEPDDTGSIMVPTALVCTSEDFLWENTIDVNQLSGSLGIPSADLRMWSRSTQQASVDLPSWMDTDITLSAIDTVAWDAYLGRVNSSDQPNERYKLVFLQNGSVEAETGWTGPSSSNDGLSTGTVTAEWVGSLGSVSLPNGADEMVIVHWSDSVYGTGDSGNANSVVPASICISGEIPADPASIGDYVWYDSNGDGVQDSNEAGIADVSVELRTAGGRLLATDITDADGNYLFTDLDPGPYSVTVVASTLPRDVVQTFDEDGTLDNTSVESLEFGEDNREHDFGYLEPTASIGDYVWFDANSDGVQDADEVGIGGVTVELRDGGVIATEVTNANGAYLFEDVNQGCYDITIQTTTLPAGVVQTFDADSAANGGTLDDASSTCLDAGENDRAQDFGYTPPPASIGDFVWYDDNSDGIQDASEAGISGVSVELREDTTGRLVGTEVTDGSGGYLFDNLDEGCYDVNVLTSTLPDGVTQTFDADGGDDDTSFECLDLGENNRDQDFGYVPPSASLGDRIWFDTDSDGTQDATEDGIEGVEVELRDASGVVGTDITDDQGNFLFEDLAPGCYDVTVVTASLPDDVVQTFDADGGLDDTSNKCLIPGEDDRAQDFGYVLPLASIGDRVWYDSDADGVQDSNENPIPGVTLQLFLDDGTLVGEDTTGTDGLYLFEDLAPGCYTVQVDTATLPLFVVQTYDADTTATNPLDHTSDECLDAGEDDRDQDFGYTVDPD